MKFVPTYTCIPVIGYDSAIIIDTHYFKVYSINKDFFNYFVFNNTTDLDDEVLAEYKEFINAYTLGSLENTEIALNIKPLNLSFNYFSQISNIIIDITNNCLIADIIKSLNNFILNRQRLDIEIRIFYDIEINELKNLLNEIEITSI